MTKDLNEYTEKELRQKFKVFTYMALISVGLGFGMILMLFVEDSINIRLIIFTTTIFFHCTFIGFIMKREVFRLFYYIKFQRVK